MLVRREYKGVFRAKIAARAVYVYVCVVCMRANILLCEGVYVYAVCILYCNERKRTKNNNNKNMITRKVHEEKVNQSLFNKYV